MRGSYARRHGFAGDAEVDAPGLHDAEPRIRHDPADEHGDVTSTEHDRMSDDGAEASDRSWTDGAQQSIPENGSESRSLRLEARFERRHPRFSLAEYEPPSYERAMPTPIRGVSSRDANTPAADVDSVTSLPAVDRDASEPLDAARERANDERAGSSSD